MYVETYSVTEGIFRVLWNGHADAQSSNAVTDFNWNIVLVVFP